MSLNLVVNYGSDSEGTDDEEDFFNEKRGSEGEKEEKEQESEPTSSSSVQVNSKSFFFSGDGGADSDGDDNNDDDDVPYIPELDDEKEAGSRKRKSTTKLDADFKSSIFDNNYSREERLNVKMLSQHVELSDKPTSTQRKSKYTCKAYLKGRCRMGDKCRFAHPSHNAQEVDANAVSLSSNAHMYDKADTEVAQIFHSKKFKSSANQ